MKKLSLFIALILCVTIGGVYATWYYANSQNEIAHDVTLAVGIDYSFTGTSGTLRIVVEDSLTPFKVEPIDEDNYKAQLVNNKAAKLVFTPYTNASNDIKNNGIDVYWYFNNADALTACTFDTDDSTATAEQQVFTYNQASGKANRLLITKDKFDKQSDGTFVYDMSADLLGSITMADFTLVNYDRYAAFSEKIKTVVFGISLTSIDPATVPAA
ncbi:MAG: hypothetical protein J6Q58_04235 [Clostridia bacterium]|nr:hypothetical protein [Clostridia bacterium]